MQKSKFYIHVKHQYIATVHATYEEIKIEFPYSEINPAANGWHVNVWCMTQQKKGN